MEGEWIRKINSKFEREFVLDFGLYGKYAITLLVCLQVITLSAHWICMQSYILPVEKWWAMYIGYTVRKWLHGIFTSGAAEGLTTE